MKAISLWQPWASLIAHGSKTIETRSRPTHYRGPLIIHAAQKMPREEWQRIADYGNLTMSIFGLPRGAIVARCTLIGWVRTDDCIKDEYWKERLLGDFTPGRFAWILTDIVPIRPVPFKGKQGFFEVPDELVRDV